MENPYIYHKPLASKRGFYNRTSEITRVVSRCGADLPQSVSIVGPPRSGKSSLINWLHDPLSQQDYLKDPSQYVFIVLALAEQRVTNPAEFYGLISAALENKGEGEMPASDSGFNAFVKRLMQQKRKLILCCDDFGLVTQHQGFPLDFFSFMRSLANSNDVAYVTTSVAPLQQLCHTQDIEESPFFNIFTTVNLSPFDQEAMRLLVSEKAEKTGHHFGAELDWILALAGPFPYQLQCTASLAFDMAQQHNKVDQGELAKRAYREMHDFFKMLWDGHFPVPQKEVLLALSHGKQVETRLQYAAESLVRHGHLQKDGETYQITSTLMARFISENNKTSFWKKIFG